MSFKKSPFSQLLSNLVSLYLYEATSKTKDPLKLTGDLIKKFEGFSICESIKGLKNIRNMIEHNVKITKWHMRLSKSSLNSILVWLESDSFRCTDLKRDSDKELRDKSISLCKECITDVDNNLSIFASNDAREYELRKLLIKSTPKHTETHTETPTNPESKDPVVSLTPDPTVRFTFNKRKSEYSDNDKILPFKKRKFIHTVEPIADQPSKVPDNYLSLIERIKAKVDKSDIIETIAHKREKLNDDIESLGCKEKLIDNCESHKKFRDLKRIDREDVLHSRVIMVDGPHRNCKFRVVYIDDKICKVKNLKGDMIIISSSNRFALV